MLEIGKFNHLEVLEEVPFGFYMDGQDEGKILLPNNSVPEGCKIGDKVKVFVYFDSDDRIIATTQIPKAQVDDCVSLKCVAVTEVGAFLDWGLEKDLFVPFREQASPMAEGLSYVVCIYVDEYTGRIAASSKLRSFLPESGDEFEQQQEVELTIFAKTEMGYKAVINGTHLGLLFRDEAFKPLRVGQRCKGYIKNIREDGKIDLSLQLHTPEARQSLTEQIIEDLIAHGGISSLTDKSSAAEISMRFNVSKGAYKKAIGALYKQKRITLDKNKITLTQA